MRHGIASRTFGYLACSALACLLAIAAPAAAQLQELDSLLPTGANESPGEKVQVSAVVTAPTETAPAVLYVTAEMQPGWHIYSITQPKGGPNRTQITLEKSTDYELAGDFIVDPAPHSRPEPLFGGIMVEEHGGRVTWVAPIKLSADADTASLVVNGDVKAQACDANSCLAPKSFPFEARLGDAPTLGAEAQEAVAKLEPSAPLDSAEPGLPPALAETPDDYRASGSHVIWRGVVTSAAPGGEAIVHLTAQPVENFHLYAYEPKDPRTPQASKPTLILLTEHPRWTIEGPTGSAPPMEHNTGGGKAERYYVTPIGWTYRLKVPDDAKPGKYPLTGMIGYQACLSGDSGVCDFPLAAQFNGDLQVTAEATSIDSPLRFAKGRSYNEVAKLAEAAGEEAPAATEAAGGGITPLPDDPANLPVWTAIGFGFLGGLILNLMPCVLPVIGLKVLSFIEQSGKDRRHVFNLNLVYSIGIVSVFAVFAGLLSAFQLGWGEQSSYAGFNIPMTAIIFVMALAFLGVWEIPIPGFVGGSAASSLAQREGFTGTFAKGVLTTLLATPCSGPGLGTALAWCTGKPTPLIFAVFLSMGLGMASPYLLIGAFPRLVRFLPKPGAWMETFKQFMGFVLLGTVVYMLSFLRPTYVVPSVALLFGLWFACWWIGRVPYTASGGKKAKAWLQAAAAVGAVFIVAFVGWERWTPQAISFAGLHNWMEYKQERRIDQILAERGGYELKRVTDENAEIPWNPYTTAMLSDLIAKNEPVLVDFTADWCATCKSLEKYVLNTNEVRAALKEAGVVPLQADMTEEAPEAKAALEELRSNGIPVVAIYPRGSSQPSKIFRGSFTQGQLLEALQEIGAKETAGERTAALP